VTSVLETVESFYADVVQHIKPWTPPPVKVRDDDPPPANIQDHTQPTSIPVTETAIIGDLVQTSAPR
jgi:hypothetical protein